MHARERDEGVLVHDQRHRAGMAVRQMDTLTFIAGKICEDGGIEVEMNNRVRSAQDCFRHNGWAISNRPGGMRLQLEVRPLHAKVIDNLPFGCSA